MEGHPFHERCAYAVIAVAVEFALKDQIWPCTFMEFTWKFAHPFRFFTGFV